MRRTLFALIGVLCVPALAMATLTEAPPDDYQIYAIFPGDIVQTATAPHPNEDQVLMVWTMDDGNGPRTVTGGVIDANVPTGGALVELDTSTDFVRDPAAAFDAGTGLWLIVWAQEDSPGAYEIFGRLMRVDGTLNPAPFRITTTGAIDSDPAFDALQPCVSSNEAGVFLVAWAADDDAFGLPDGGFEIFRRTVDAASEALGPVVQQTNFAPLGGAATHPAIGYYYSNDSWVMLWEADGTSDPNVYEPHIYGNLIAASGLPRTPAEPVLLSGGGGARRAVGLTARNPSLAVDRLNQQAVFVWDSREGGAPASQLVNGVIYDENFAIVRSAQFRDLSLEGHGPNSYVRDPQVTHSRISGTYVCAWRESLYPADGTGQTIIAAEFDEVTGLTGPSLSIVNQGVVGPLPTEFGPPVVEGGWRSNGRVFSAFVADQNAKGEFWLYGQGLDTQAATAAPPDATPTKFAVRVAPNPFNPRTSIELALPIAGRARVDIFDVRGRLVRQLIDEDLPAGEYSRTWSGLDDRGQRVASGVYMVRVHHPGGERILKATLVE